jgi:hypothetical protein
MTQTQEDGGVPQGQGDGEKSQDLTFDAFKHLTTLNTGSIVLIGTFLRDIFPKDNQGNLLVDTGSKLLIATSFLLFGLSLAASAYSMYWVATPNVPSWFSRKSKELLYGSEENYERMLSFLMLSAGTFFFFGLVCFGVAVLTNLL